MLIQSFTDPYVAEIHQTRWKVNFVIVDKGKRYEFVVSADQALTEGDGIWFGTKEEYDKFLNHHIFNKNYEQEQDKIGFNAS